MNLRKTDLHTHIIPDIDDGSPDLQTSLSLIKKAYQQGITTIFATSHGFAYIDEKESQRSHQAFDLLKKSLKEEEIPVDLFLGCELLCMDRWTERQIQGLNSGQYPSMNGTRYILVEFTTFGISEEEVISCVDKFLEAGWIPVFAHIERYAESFASIDFIKRMREKGCLFQVNYYSLVLEPNYEIRNLAKTIIRNELADFMGSDCHSLTRRPPMITDGLDFLHRHCRKEYLSDLLYENTYRYFIKKINE